MLVHTQLQLSSKAGVRTKLATYFIYSTSENGLCLVPKLLCFVCLEWVYVSVFCDQIAIMQQLTTLKAKTAIPSWIEWIQTLLLLTYISDDAFFLAGILPSSVRPTPTQVPQTGAQTLLNKTRFDSTAGWFTQVAPDPRCGRNKERPDFVIGRIMKFIFRIGALRRSNKNKYQRC